MQWICHCVHGKSIRWVFLFGLWPRFLGFVVFSAVCFAVSAGETQVWLGDLRVVVFCLVVVFGFVASIDLPTPRRAISATSATLEEKKPREATHEGKQEHKAKDKGGQEGTAQVKTAPDKLQNREQRSRGGHCAGCPPVGGRTVGPLGPVFLPLFLCFVLLRGFCFVSSLGPNSFLVSESVFGVICPVASHGWVCLSERGGR